MANSWIFLATGYFYKWEHSSHGLHESSSLIFTWPAEKLPPVLLIEDHWSSLSLPSYSTVPSLRLSIPETTVFYSNYPIRLHLKRTPRKRSVCVTAKNVRLCDELFSHPLAFHFTVCIDITFCTLSSEDVRCQFTFLTCALYQRSEGRDKLRWKGEVLEEVTRDFLYSIQLIWLPILVRQITLAMKYTVLHVFNTHGGFWTYPWGSLGPS